MSKKTFEEYTTDLARRILIWEDADDINIARDFGDLTVENLQLMATAFLNGRPAKAESNLDRLECLARDDQVPDELLGRVFRAVFVKYVDKNA